MALDPETFDALLDAVRRFVSERLRPLETQVEADDAIPDAVVAEIEAAHGVRVTVHAADLSTAAAMYALAAAAAGT